jgi:hypothetical protein
LGNDGQHDVAITDFGIICADGAPDVTVFGAAQASAVPTFVGAGTGVSLRLAARPTHAADFTGTLHVHARTNSDVDVDVPLHVVGVLLPIAVARIASVGGVAVDADTADAHLGADSRNNRRSTHPHNRWP